MSAALRPISVKWLLITIANYANYVRERIGYRLKGLSDEAA
jgi:hypothetical protein